MKAGAVGALMSADSRLLWRDPLLGWMLLLPIALALLLRVLVPRVDIMLAANDVAIAPYLPLIMGGYLMTAPGIAGMVTGFLLLDERDAHTLDALRVSPVSMRVYLAYRITLPLLIGTTAAIAGYLLADISPLPFRSLLVIALVAAPSAPIIALVLATVAPNKVAGFALVKVLNGINLLPIAAFFLPLPLQYLAGIFPTYWPMRALWSVASGDHYGVQLVIGAIVGGGALIAAAWALDRRLLRHG